MVTSDRVVHLYNEQGEKRDKFSTKPAQKGPKNYLVRDIAFSPDSTKLAIAQSDNIVFVYKLGLEWGAKKSICNKFLQSSPVTCLAWPQAHPNKVVFGVADGKMKVGQLRSNKAATLFTTDSYVVSCCASPDGQAVLSGHVDGAIHVFYFDDGSGGPSHQQFAHHSCVPYSLGWGASVVAGGADGAVTFYNPQSGAVERCFDYQQQASFADDANAKPGAREAPPPGSVKEFTVARFNPSGESVVLGNYHSFYVYNYDHRTGGWEEAGIKRIENYYTVTALAWKQDGSRLTVGTLNGCVDLFDACIRRFRYRGAFEFTYVSLSQVIVKRLSSGERIVLKSCYNAEITKINVYGEENDYRHLVANTTQTLLVGDLKTCKLSEVPWTSSGAEKYVFDNAAVCMVFNHGELSLIEYGRNEVLGSCRTENMKPTLISVRINERPPRAEPTEDGTVPPVERDANGDRVVADNKRIAYLLDVQTVRVLDLTTGVTVATVNHDSKIARRTFLRTPQSIECRCMSHS